MCLFYTVQNQQVYFASCRLKNVIKIGKLLALKAFCRSWTYPDAIYDLATIWPLCRPSSTELPVRSNDAQPYVCVLMSI